ncbi:MAG: hypothetical protein JWL79_3706 [Frankiales bacterium]|nr:hypothetical protein [Frankiales bacterium]
MHPQGSILPALPPPDPRRKRRLVAVIVGAVLGLVALLTIGGWAVGRLGTKANSLAADRHGQPPVVADLQAGGMVIDPAGAAQVLNQYWSVHERALVDRDLATLGRLSAGPAREWEQSNVACRCLVVRTPRPLLDTAYFVTRQTRYPATFVTEAQTSVGGQYWAELLVFTKVRAGAPWLVTQDSGFGPAPGVAPQLGGPIPDSAGFDQPVTTSQHRRAQTLAADFAAVWQEAKNTGTVPSGTAFDLTGQTGRRLFELASHRQDTVQRNGLLGHYRFYASPSDQLVEVTDTNGADLACQTVRETVVYRPTAGQRIRQDLWRRNWGPDLRPGLYRQVTDQVVWGTCFIISPNAAAPIGVLNQDVGGGATTGIS